MGGFVAGCALTTRLYCGGTGGPHAANSLTSVGTAESSMRHPSARQVDRRRARLSPQSNICFYHRAFYDGLRQTWNLSTRTQTGTWTKRQWGVRGTCSKANFSNAFKRSQRTHVGSMS